MFQEIVKFVRDEEGLTTVEYAVAGALVAGTLVAAFTDLGERVGEVITELTGSVSGGGG